MYHIKVYNAIAHEALERLDANAFAITDADPQGILLRSYNLRQETLPDSLLAIARAGAGTNNIPVEECAGKGIVVFNTPGANSNAVKELVIASMIIAARNLVSASRWAQTLQGDIEKQTEAGKKQFRGQELTGKTIGIAGMGAIGSRLARDCVSLGMRVLAYDPFFTGDAPWMNSASVRQVDKLELLVQESDFITLHVPYNKLNHHLMNKKMLKKMRPGAVLLNFSRGPLVDADALLEQIGKGTGNRYITDFPEEKLIGQDGVLLYPHLGASTGEAEVNCAMMAVESLTDYLANGNIKNSVNFPDVHLDGLSVYRFCIFNRNIVNMIGKISTALAERQINIEHIVNRSKGDYAYTMVDIGDVDPAVVQEVTEFLREQEGIVRVRVIGGQ